jgi:hypothetical protein
MPGRDAAKQHLAVGCTPGKHARFHFYIKSKDFSRRLIEGTL